MIILFHWAYVLATTLFTSIFQRQHNGLETITAQNLTEITAEQEPIVKPMRDQINATEDGEASLLQQSTQLQHSSNTKESTSIGCEFESDIESDVGIRFHPPVYAQRYMAVQDVLMDKRWEGNVKKIVDFGCAEFGLFQYVKHIPGIEEIVTVDIDEELLKKHCCRAAPLNCDYLGNREHPLSVRVYSGSIAKPDRRLLGTDAVVCIEIIEHLWPDEVEAVPNNVFGFIQPLLAIFTTPNSDFNVLFPNFSGFRHWDHKFEWSREEFHCWATNIVTRYPAYEVTFHGVGAGPPGTEKYGHCSQMALFVRRPTLTNSLIQEQVVGGEEMKLVSEYIYPFRPDERTEKEKICHEAEYQLRFYGNSGKNCSADGICEIPIRQLLPFVEKWCTSVDVLRGLLVENGWEISDMDPQSPTVIYPHFGETSSSQSEDDYDPTDCLNSANQDPYVPQAVDSEEDWDVDGPEVVASYVPEVDEWEEASNDSVWPKVRLPNSVDHSSNGRQVFSLNGLKSGVSLNAKAGGTARTNAVDHIVPNRRAVSSELPDCSARLEMAVDDVYYVNELNMRNLSPESRKPLPAAQSVGACALNGDRKRAATDGCARTSLPSEALPGCSGGGSGGGGGGQQPSDSSLRMNVSDTSSDDTCCADWSRLERDASGPGRAGSDTDSDAESDGSQAGVDNRVARRRPQPHRNHIVFGLNNAVVENGDVANNNRDGEGNNVVGNDEPPDDEIYLEIDMFEDEVGDHELVEDHIFDVEDFDEEDEDANEALLVPADVEEEPFPVWLLNLLEVANHGGGELGGAGEPQWSPEDQL